MIWYKQNRNVFERVWAKDPKMISVYLYLHCHAYVQDGMLGGRLIRKGSCPTSNAAIMESTGLSEHDVKSRLEKLKNYGEIIIKSSNLGKIVTLCDYDSSNATEDLFGFNPSNGLPSQSPSELPTQLPTKSPTYIDNKNIEYNIRSHYIPSNKRESKGVAYEIKAIYNKMFDGILRKWERLSADMVIKVETCVNRYGRQSVDMVFDQVKHEKFSLGDNNTGFIADFAFIFKLANYEAYLGRYELRLKQGNKKPQQEPQKKSVGVIADEPQRQPQTDEQRRQSLIELIDYVKSNPRSLSCVQLEGAYRSGELQRLGIDWKPNNI